MHVRMKESDVERGQKWKCNSHIHGYSRARDEYYQRLLHTTGLTAAHGVESSQVAQHYLFIYFNFLVKPLPAMTSALPRQDPVASWLYYVHSYVWSIGLAERMSCYSLETHTDRVERQYEYVATKKIS
jgi:hypothetical protein